MTNTDSKPRPPSKLGPGGAQLWRDIAGEFDLRADEYQYLADACRERDLIDSLEDEQRDSPKLVQGSRPGQLVINPIISELRMHRSTLAGLLTRLQLPNDDERAARVASTRSQLAVKAARARWDRTG